MTEEQLTNEQLIEKCQKLEKENQTLFAKYSDLTIFFSSVMASAHSYIDDPIFEKNRDTPMYFKVTCDEELIKKYGLFR